MKPRFPALEEITRARVLETTDTGKCNLVIGSHEI
jgi:hypothetical protein